MENLGALVSQFFLEINSAERVLVGYSGGLDSTLLLASLVKVADPLRILAVHINHQTGEHSDHWEAHCRSQAQQFGCHFHAEKISISEDSGFEEKAREKRYQIFRSLMKQGDILMLGHHADDQVETILFRLFRGSGIKGLAGIPVTRDLGNHRVFRPLLNVTKSHLRQLAEMNSISWVEDQSNADSQFDRNFIRNELLPKILNRWPQAAEKILQTSVALSDADLLISEVADEDLLLCELRKESVGKSIDINALYKLSELRRHNCFRRLVYVADGNQPNQKIIHSIEQDLLAAARDAQPFISLTNVDIRRFNGRLYVTPKLPELADSGGRLMEWAANADTFEMEGLWRIKKLGDLNQAFSIGFRRGGERAKPWSRAHSQTVKKLMHENCIEPWLRDLLPVIYEEDQIVAIGDRIKCSEFQFELLWLIEQDDCFR